MTDGADAAAVQAALQPPAERTPDCSDTCATFQAEGFALSLCLCLGSIGIGNYLCPGTPRRIESQFSTEFECGQIIFISVEISTRL